MKIGTRVEVSKNNAAIWGYKTPAFGTVIGNDPNGSNPDVVAVRLDQGVSLYEVKGCHIKRLQVVINQSAGSKEEKHGK